MTPFNSRLKTYLIITADLFSFFLSLKLVLLFRYGLGHLVEQFWAHAPLFVVLFGFWGIICYILDFFRAEKIRQKSLLFSNLLIVFSLFTTISLIFILIFGGLFLVSPRWNLLLFCLVFFALDYLARIILWDFYLSKFKTQVLFLDNSKPAQELSSMFCADRQLGYEVISDWQQLLDGKLSSGSLNNLLVVAADSENDEQTIKNLYRLVVAGASIIGTSDLYESIFLKVPTDFITENWFIDHVRKNNFYDLVKRIIDIVLSIILLIVLSPIIIATMLVAWAKEGSPVIYAHPRMSKNNKPFMLYKIRTMVKKHDGLQWTMPGDKRVTKIGKFLRRTHLDEFPQLFNILKGDISFVGPRPEQEEVVKMLEEKVKYYDIRSIVKPGLTGWAQIHYKASASVDEAEEKLRFDFYYIKNRSLVVDFLIMLKTAKLFFVNPE